MSCGCGSGGAANTDLWEARTASGPITLANGATQGTKGQAIEAARGVSGSYLKKV